MAVCSDVYIKEQLGTFRYFALLNSLVHLLLFSNDHQPSVINYQSGRGVLKQAAGCFQSANAGDVFDLIRHRAGVSLSPAECHQPRHKSPHLSPKEINTAPSSSLFSRDEKTRTETERSTDTRHERRVKVIALTPRKVLSQQSGLRSPRLISCGHR